MHDDNRKNNRFKTSNALSKEERQEIARIACSPEFQDRSPRQIVPILAENGFYLASESTFYRVLRACGLIKHRYDSKPPKRKKPEELAATGPNQVWTWDISYLRSMVTGIYFYLYVIVDIWDRTIVAWAVHECESGELARELISEASMQNDIRPDQLTVHQDNGSPMISSEFLAALEYFRIAPSYSRPGVCDDNPYSESLFRTLKYRPSFPERFESIDDVQKWMKIIVDWYNNEHRHSGISYVSPAQRRRGEDIEMLERRKKTYEAARNAHPERWSRDIRKWEHVKEVKLNPRSKKNRQENAA